jgi:hypothetical protein
MSQSRQIDAVRATSALPQRPVDMMHHGECRIGLATKGRMDVDFIGTETDASVRGWSYCISAGLLCETPACDSFA